MARIVTLTLNPAIDGASAADRVVPTIKIRTSPLRLDPGGGGINVARVLARLGAEVEALYLAGGVTGHLLDGLVARVGLSHQRIQIMGETRMSLVVRERQGGQEYRFVPEGPELAAAEAAAVVERVAGLDCDWLVLSGSLPRGVAPDYLAGLVAAARRRGIRVVVDTSGPALAATLAAGGVTLAKPSLEEMVQLVGHPLPTAGDLLAAAGAVVAAGGAQMLVVSMGKDGALLVADGVAEQLPALPVPVKSAVGAGDSFVAAMLWGLAQGRPLAEAFRLGMAGGAAAVMTPGTELAMAADIARLAGQLGVRL